MKKLFAIILAVCMLSFSLVACDFEDLGLEDVVDGVKDGLEEFEELTCEQVMEKAGEALKASKFEVKMSMNYDCKDPQYAEQFAAANASVNYFVDGNNLRSTVNIRNINVEMLIVDNMLYYTVPSQNVKFKASVSDAQMKDLMDDMDMSFDTSSVADEFDNYDNVSMVKDGDTHTITCTGISDEAMNELLKETDFASIDGKVKDIKCVMTVKNGKIEKMEVSSIFDIQMPNAQTRTEIAFVSLVELKYTDISPITAPADAGTYTEKTFAELFGE